MTNWNVDNPYVVLALRYIRSRRSVTPMQLVTWDNSHGRNLFEWDDEQAGIDYRVHQARLFFNRLRLKIGEYRIREFINVPSEDERAYFPIEKINEDPQAREAVIADLTRRMKTLAMELRFWKLSAPERRKILEKVRQILEVSERAVKQLR